MSDSEVHRRAEQRGPALGPPTGGKNTDGAIATTARPTGHRRRRANERADAIQVAMISQPGGSNLAVLATSPSPSAPSRNPTSTKATSTTRSRGVGRSYPGAAREPGVINAARIPDSGWLGTLPRLAAAKVRGVHL